MIGKRITHYEITAKLGEGGMGDVCGATVTRLWLMGPFLSGLPRFQQQVSCFSGLTAHSLRCPQSWGAGQVLPHHRPSGASPREETEK